MGFGPIKLIKGLLIVAIASLVLGVVVMLLWNALIPDLFHGPVLTYWQSVGLFFLSKLLVGHIPGGGSRGKRHWGKHEWARHEWKGGPGQGKWSWTMTNEDPSETGSK